jgi:hypothetical protein
MRRAPFVEVAAMKTAGGSCLDRAVLALRELGISSAASGAAHVR